MSCSSMSGLVMSWAAARASARSGHCPWCTRELRLFHRDLGAGDHQMADVARHLGKHPHGLKPGGRHQHRHQHAPRAPRCGMRTQAARAGEATARGSPLARCGRRPAITACPMVVLGSGSANWFVPGHAARVGGPSPGYINDFPGHRRTPKYGPAGARRLTNGQRHPRPPSRPDRAGPGRAGSGSRRRRAPGGPSRDEHGVRASP